jgi:hypothetical protein
MNDMMNYVNILCIRDQPSLASIAFSSPVSIDLTGDIFEAKTSPGGYPVAHEWRII